MVEAPRIATAITVEEMGRVFFANRDERLKCVDRVYCRLPDRRDWSAE